MVDDIARTLCGASRSDPLSSCPYCERGRCQPKMWTTFRGEAAAVWAMLQRAGVVKAEPRRLPGLGE